MDDAMVTGRMSQQKKQAGNAVLQRAGLTASAAINRMYELLAEHGNADFLELPKAEHSPDEWKRAAERVRSLKLPFKVDSRFDSMTNAQVKMERLSKRGLA